MATASSFWHCVGEERGREREGMRQRRVDAKVQATAAAALTFQRRGSCKRACAITLPALLPFLLPLSRFASLLPLALFFSSPSRALPWPIVHFASMALLQLCRRAAFTLPPRCLYSVIALPLLCLCAAFALPFALPVAVCVVVFLCFVGHKYFI